jgi:hypothetical protein
MRRACAERAVLNPSFPASFLLDAKISDESNMLMWAQTATFHILSNSFLLPDSLLQHTKLTRRQETKRWSVAMDILFCCWEVKSIEKVICLN